MPPIVLKKDTIQRLVNDVSEIIKHPFGRTWNILHS